MANLAKRLRILRTGTWPGTRVTQLQLAAALDVSPALISAWEKSGATPPEHRLEAYARFFATQRSVAVEPYRLLEVGELTEAENADREELFEGLLALAAPATVEPQTSGLPFDGTMFQFPPREEITIVCAELPEDRQVPSTHSFAHRYADLDALLELHGHIRAANPWSRVLIRVAPLSADEYATHLVLLGEGWNPAADDLMSQIDTPVRRSAHVEDGTPGGFEVGPEGEPTVLTPSFQSPGTLVEDVALFHRSVSPFDIERTVNLCCGMSQSGTLGMVRALTDERFRDRNERYLRERFGGSDTFVLVSRVHVVGGVVVTPDWSAPDDRLFEWCPG